MMQPPCTIYKTYSDKGSIIGSVVALSSEHKQNNIYVTVAQCFGNYYFYYCWDQQ